MTRWLCDHCEAVVQTLCSADQGTDLVCGACHQRFQGSPTTTLNRAAPNRQDVPSQNILLAAIEILKKNVGCLLCVSVIVNIVWFAVVSGGAGLIRIQYERVRDGVGDATAWSSLVVLGCIAPFVLAIVSAYAMMVIARLSLSLVRPGSSQAMRIVSALKVPMKALCRVATVLLLAGTAMAGALAVGLVVTVLFSLFAEPNTATFWGTMLTGVILFAVVFLLQWLLWPVLFLIADERTDLMHGLNWGLKVSWQHRKLAISLITVYFVLSTFGALAAYVGQAITTPIAMLPLAIGYVRMTGGQIREPV